MKDAADPMGLRELAPGVWGYTAEEDGALYVPVCIAEREGSGDVGRYLDSLPLDRTVKFPNVINGRLAGMLARRGFVPTMELSEEFGPVEVYVRDALKPGPYPYAAVLGAICDVALAKAGRALRGDSVSFEAARAAAERCRTLAPGDVIAFAVAELHGGPHEGIRGVDAYRQTVRYITSCILAAILRGEVSDVTLMPKSGARE